MTWLPKPDVILTHDGDLDGLIAGVLLRRLAHRLFEAEVRLEAWNSHGFRQRPLQETSAWLADIPFEPRLDKPGWVIIDHHATEARPQSAHWIHDLTKSAALLCYELCAQHGLASPALDRLVRLSNVADLFLEDDPDFLLASDYANLVKIYGFWNLHALVGGQIEKLLDHPLLEVMAAKRRIEDPLGYAWSKANLAPLSPTVGYVPTVIGNSNLILHRLLEENATPYPVLLTMVRRGNGTVVVSLRSRHGEALKVAEKLQGGGHANAAAAVLPKSIRTVADGIEYLRQVLNPKPPAPPWNSLARLLDGVELPPQ